MEETNKDESTVHLGFRVEPELRERVDRMVERLGAHLGGANVSRSTVLTMCVTNYLKKMEEDYR
jgi:hypothetical protein